MIVRERPGALQLFFVLRGSLLSRIRQVLLVTVLLVVLVTVAHRLLDSHNAVLVSTIPFPLIGLPLAIFLGFRNSARYDRYWEARKLWGDLLVRSRNLARQVLHLIDIGSSVADPRDLAAAAGGCERIRNKPLPFSYALLLHRTAYLYCFLLPFGLVDSIGLMTPLIVAILAYTFFGLDALGDPKLPPPLQPVDYLLL